ncbi:hypothetical protein [Pseudomonas sp. zfem005]|uniref:GAP1-N1 domain-containing protein n=1 Tax=Pseudomonas sp. zfem005 TaxID=3078200 RepID=UPI0029298D74|nr:hypothetical protein [Pseudomonas sp. zfem005]MDU9416279.1 hypothetical protein [Pseudomonas sp. zfem005]
MGGGEILISLFPLPGLWGFELVITAEIQIHGYRKGHQLIASSIVLSKEDQAVIDRLSDIAGPLRPKEQFAPYLSAYPLPSGSHYVIARTWQDHTVARAGCVRTMSVLIDAHVWAIKAPLVPLLNLLELSGLPSEQHAVRIDLNECAEERLPPTPSFSASELLEALFLEDSKPVVVFDAPAPELIALRILTALWPDIRRRFAISTFALSPRKISGRDLDLVFAPMSAKAKFSDWPGRRVDGRSLQHDRHRWTEAIVQRVFAEPLPRLLSEREINLLGERDANSATALRIALLWDELLDKLQQAPTAALGLLDIANSGMVSNTVALKYLEPLLAEAISRATSTLPDRDAWDFVGALTRKMYGQSMPAGKAAAAHLAGQLAERTPFGAISFLVQPDSKGAIVDLIPSIAAGLAKGAEPIVEQALFDAPKDIVANLVAHDADLSRRVVDDDALIERMGQILSDVDQDLADRAGKMLLPYLIDDRQLPVAKPIVNRMDSAELAEELSWLGKVNEFKAKRLSSMLIERAHKVGGTPAIREVLVLSGASAQRDSLIALSIEPTKADVHWLLGEKRLAKATFSKLLVGVLEQASDDQLTALLSDSEISECILKRLPKDAVEMLVRIAMQDSLPINVQISVVGSLIPRVSDSQRVEIASRAIMRCLRSRFEGEETELLLMLLEAIGAKLNGVGAVNAGLGRGVDSDVASRNLIVFDMAPLPARERIVGAVDEIALALHSRHAIDFDQMAADACASIMFDAEKKSRKSLLIAAGMLMPSLLRARRFPVSPIIVVLFPPLYRELARSNDVPDFLNFVPFFDWDRCKTARRELVDAFISSSWKPGDLALIAYHCNDVVKILEHVSKSYKGGEYLSLIENDLSRLNANGQEMVARTISGIRLGKF